MVDLNKGEVTREEIPLEVASLMIMMTSSGEGQACSSRCLWEVEEEEEDSSHFNSSRRMEWVVE